MLTIAVDHHVLLMAALLSERARGPNLERRAGRAGGRAWYLVALASVAGAVART